MRDLINIRERQITMSKKRKGKIQPKSVNFTDQAEEKAETRPEAETSSSWLKTGIMITGAIALIGAAAYYAWLGEMAASELVLAGTGIANTRHILGMLTPQQPLAEISSSSSQLAEIQRNTQDYDFCTPPAVKEGWQQKASELTELREKIKNKIRALPGTYSEDEEKEFEADRETMIEDLLYLAARSQKEYCKIMNVVEGWDKFAFVFVPVNYFKLENPESKNTMATYRFKNEEILFPRNLYKEDRNRIRQFLSHELVHAADSKGNIERDVPTPGMFSVPVSYPNNYDMEFSKQPDGSWDFGPDYQRVMGIMQRMKNRVQAFRNTLTIIDKPEHMLTRKEKNLLKKRGPQLRELIKLAGASPHSYQLIDSIVSDDEKFAMIERWPERIKDKKGVAYTDSGKKQVVHTWGEVSLYDCTDRQLTKDLLDSILGYFKRIPELYTFPVHPPMEYGAYAGQLLDRLDPQIAEILVPEMVTHQKTRVPESMVKCMEEESAFVPKMSR